jgi:hypothetical protein
MNSVRPTVTEFGRHGDTVAGKTESISRRYAIVDEAMLKEGAAKLQSASTSTNRGPEGRRRDGQWSLSIPWW